MKKFRYAEQTGKVVKLITDSGYELCQESDLLTFIEKEKLNFDLFYSHNTSPFGDGDPRFDVEVERAFCTPEEYLDTEWDEVTKKYYESINSGSVDLGRNPLRHK